MATLISDSASSEHAARATLAAKTDGNVGFGQLLKGARERSGLSLQQIASETKISPRHLEALERGDVPEASERFYRRADIRTYARAVHCDDHPALASFDRAVQASTAAQPALAPAPRRDPLLSQPRVAAGAAVLLLAAVLGRVVGSPQSFVRDASPVNGEAASAVQGATVPAPKPDAIPAAHPSPLDQPQPPVTAVRLSAPPSAAQALASAPVMVDSAAVVLPTTGTTSAPAASSTELIVTTEPAGARVTVNGVGWGVAPVTIRHLSAGTKRVRITLDGFVSEEHVVNLTDRGSKTINLRLTSR